MNRRQALAALSLASVAVFAPASHRRVRAAPSAYTGPFFLMVNAAGGWDPTLFCDPKGGASGDRTTTNQTYREGDIARVGAFSVAPVSATVTAGTNTAEVYSARRFFETHGNRLTVLSGVDTETNGHDTGSRTVWSGRLSEGYPSLAALMAATHTGQISVPMPFLSYGGHDATEGLVPVTRAGSVAALSRIAYPHRISPSDSASDTYLSPDTQTRIARAQAERLAAMTARASLPAERDSLSSLHLARTSDVGLAMLAERLEGAKTVGAADLPDLSSVASQLGALSGLMQQVDLTILAMQAGVMVSANLNLGGFDTHSDHDRQHALRLMILLRGLDYLFARLDAAGLRDKTMVVVGSDFGRTPFYNSGNGKDHWNVTSLLLSGPNLPSGTVIGATDSAFKSRRLDPSTLAPIEGESGGEKLTTAAVHGAIRRVTGIEGHAVSAKYPLAASPLRLFG